MRQIRDKLTWLHNNHIDYFWQLVDCFSNFYDASVIHEQVKIPKNGVCPVTGRQLERLPLVKFEDLQNQVRFVDEE